MSHYFTSRSDVCFMSFGLLLKEELKSFMGSVQELCHHYVVDNKNASISKPVLYQFPLETEWKRTHTHTQGGIFRSPSVV